MQKDKQRSTKQISKAKDRVARNALKTEDELMCSVRVSSLCSISDTHCVNLVRNLLVSHEREKDREVPVSTKHCNAYIALVRHSLQTSVTENPREKQKRTLATFGTEETGRKQTNHKTNTKK